MNFELDTSSKVAEYLEASMWLAPAGWISKNNTF